jgi:hypothetical protein
MKAINFIFSLGLSPRTIITGFATVFVVAFHVIAGLYILKGKKD